MKVIIAITGASGSIYAKVLLDKLSRMKNQIDEVGLIMSKNAMDVWKYELGNTSYEGYNFKIYQKDDFFAPFASGSAQYTHMIVVPSRIAQGTSNDLITRSADVILKERRKLILLSRETPLSLIHINNMKTITEAGGIIMPAAPSFYSKPNNFEELATTVVDRAIDLLGLEQDSYRWNS